MAGSQAEPLIHVRLLTEPHQAEEAVKLQQEIWGFHEIDLLPVRLFLLARKIGGHVFGAYDGERMAGFCLAIPGVKPGGIGYLHSHMLGVHAAYRDRGVGRALKLAQRDDALARGIQLIEWTFDPLEIKNAFFNIERLGAVIRRYVLNQYGISSSRLHGTLPTDRCVAEWYVDSGRVRAILAGSAPPRSPVEERIVVPAAIERLRSEASGRARDIQRQVSEQFQTYLDRGLTVTGFERSAEAGTYLLSKWQSE